MVKARTIYIFEGPDEFCICKGYKIEPHSTNTHLMIAKMKHKGVFGNYFLATVNEELVSKPKKLRVGDKLLDGWEVIRIKADFVTKEPYIPDINPRLLERAQSSIIQSDLIRSKLFTANRLNRDINDANLYQKKVRDDIKFARKVIYDSGQSSMFGGGYPFYRGFGQPQQQSSENEEE